MRISELSHASGVSIPTIKYYLREGLLQPGSRSAPNQAQYDQGHIHRLRLIRALMDVGGLGVAGVRSTLEAIADERLPMHGLLGLVHGALGPPPDAGVVPDDVERARADVDRFLRNRAWRVAGDNPARRVLADTLVALRRLDWDVAADVFSPYADAVDRLAAFEIDYVATTASRADAVEAAVVGTVVFEAALVALRRLAEAHHSARRFATEASADQ